MAVFWECELVSQDVGIGLVQDRDPTKQEAGGLPGFCSSVLCGLSVFHCIWYFLTCCYLRNAIYGKTAIDKQTQQRSPSPASGGPPASRYL